MNKIQILRSISLRILPCMLLLTTSCITKTNSGGYVNDIDFKEEIAIGMTTRDQVAERLGSPSAQSTFGTETWYYISNKQETVAFFESEITDQRITTVEFDPNGVVSGVKHLSRKDALEFDTVSRVTPTEGRSMTIVEQLLGNVGRFNSPGGGPNAMGSRRPGSNIPGGSPGGF